MRLIFRVFVILASVVITHKVIMSKLDIKSKPVPEYKTIDPDLASFADRYKSLAEKRGIKFTHEVSIGFKKITYDHIVGLCHYGTTWREIDVDIDNWKKSTDNEKEELLFHELTHCYCTRKHDFDDGDAYPEAESSRKRKVEVSKKPPYDDRYFISPGFLIDGCPSSIMYPYTIGDACVEKHKDYYESEMLNRCKPF